MGSNEDYLDNLLESMLAEESGKNSASQESLIENSTAEESEGDFQTDDMDLDALLNSLEGIEDITELSENSEASGADAEPETDIFSTGEETAEEPEETFADNVLEDTAPSESKMLSPEEIEAMFAQMDEEEALEEAQQNEEAQAAESMPGAEPESPEDELLAMLSGMDEQNEDLNEINSLLEKSDHNEMVDDDMLALLEDTPDEEEGMQNISEEMQPDELIASDGEETGRRKKKPRKERVKKERKKKEPKEKKPKEKKEGGFMQKLFHSLTEEDVPEEAEQVLSDSIGELEAGEDAAPKKEKAKKEKKPKKEKKEKEKKPKKEKKPRKEKVKKEKPPKPPKTKSKPLPKKKTATVVFFAATIFAAVMLLTEFVPNILEGKKAKEAFEQADYSTVYELLSGRERSKEEEKLYQSALLVEQMNRSMDSYLNYQRMGMDIQALDALIKGVGKYQTMQNIAEQYGVQSRVGELYQAILAALDSAYGISEEEALEILNAKDDVYYTMALKRAVGAEVVSGGTTDVNETEYPADIEEGMGTENGEAISDEELPADFLPEELDIQ